MNKDEFARIYQRDPYTAMIARMYADAWALGYEAARRDVVGVTSDETDRVVPGNPLAPACDVLYSSDGSQLRNRALAELFERQQAAEIQFVLALASLAPSLGGR